MNITEYDEIKITDDKVSANPCCVYHPLEKQFKWVENEETEALSYEQRRKKEKLYMTWIRSGGSKLTI